MTCEEIERGDLVEEYLLGRLRAAARDAVDAHLFECDRCFERLQTLRAVRRELAATKAAAPARAARAIRWEWKWALVPAFATLVIATLIVWPRIVAGPAPQSIAPADRIARNPTPTADPRPDAGARLAELGRFGPPPYEPGTLRGSQDEASTRFRDAMRAYRAGDCRAAIPDLRAAAELDPAAAHATFFLGICHGVAGELEESARSLRRTIAIGNTPYLEEAHFYLALVLLQQGEARAAREQLTHAIALRGALEGRARAMLGELNQLAPES